MQVAGLFGVPSLYSYVMGVVPTGKVEPRARPDTKVPLRAWPPQLSPNTGAAYVTTAEQSPVEATVMSSGQLTTTGASASVTYRAADHVALTPPTRATV